MVREFLERYLLMFDLGELCESVELPRTHDLSVWRVTLENAGTRTAYLLTQFEQLSFDQAPQQIRLMANLHAAGLPVPSPLATLDGMAMTIFSGKPALLVREPSGTSITSPNAAQCHAMGDLLARVQQQLLASGLNSRVQPADEFLTEALRSCEERLPGEDFRELANSRAANLGLLAGELPSGLGHGHPVRSSLHFAGDQPVAFSNFQRARTMRWLHDLATAIADWCQDAAGNMDAARYEAMLSGYSAVRQLTAAERACWPASLNLAVTDLWLDALLDDPDQALADAPVWHQRLARMVSFSADLL